MTLPDFLTQAPDGEIRLAGHRIGLFHVVQGYNEGESAEMLASRYPTLPLSLVHKAIAFISTTARKSTPTLPSVPSRSTNSVVQRRSST
jgi:uncharacterized protein (DUF433 family)